MGVHVMLPSETAFLMLAATGFLRMNWSERLVCAHFLPVWA